MLDIMYTAFGV